MLLFTIRCKDTTKKSNMQIFSEKNVYARLKMFILPNQSIAVINISTSLSVLYVYCCLHGLRLEEMRISSVSGTSNLFVRAA